MVLTGEQGWYLHHALFHSRTAAAPYAQRRLLLHLIVKFRPTAALLNYYMTFTNWLMDHFPWYEWLMLKLAKLIRGYSSGMFLWFQMTRVYHAIESMNKVTIAAMNGPCNGGGTELSACFDFRFMIGDQGFHYRPARVPG